MSKNSPASHNYVLMNRWVVRLVKEPMLEIARSMIFPRFFSASLQNPAAWLINANNTTFRNNINSAVVK